MLPTATNRHGMTNQGPDTGLSTSTPAHPTAQPFRFAAESKTRNCSVDIQELVRAKEHVYEAVQRALRRIRGLDAGGFIELFQIL